MEQSEQVEAPAAQSAAPSTGPQQATEAFAVPDPQGTAVSATVNRLIGTRPAGGGPPGSPAGRATLGERSETRLQAAALLRLQRTAGNAAVSRMVAGRPVAGPARSRSLARHASSSDSGMPPGTQAWLEERLGHDFGHVRVHADGEASRRTAALGARAVTEGSNIYVHPAHYQPHTRAGLGLLAHELTHVVQQQRGQFPAVPSQRPAAARLALEDEAERAELAVQRAGPPVSVTGRARPGVAQASLWDDLKARATGGIEALVDWVLSQAEAAGQPLLAELNELRKSLKGLTELQVSPETAAWMEALYHEWRDLLPDWVPVPDVSFGGPASQHAGAIAIPIAAIILLLLMAILILWYAGNLDPTTRKARERAAQELVDKIKEALKPKADPKPPEPKPDTKPKPEPKPDPKPDPKPEPKPDPRPPPVDPIPGPPEKDKKPRIEKVADSNIFMDRIEGGPAQRARIDLGYLANPQLTLFVPAAAIAEATRVDPHGTQAKRLAGQPGGARIIPDIDGDVEALRPDFPQILSAKFDENDLRIATRARDRILPLLSANSAMVGQLVNPAFPKRVAAVGMVTVEVP